MDTIHRIVSRSLIDRSQKRSSKRLVADESFNDVNIVAAKDDWNLYLSNLNPNFEMLNCDVQYSTNLSGCNSLLSSTEDGLTPSPNASNSSNASASGDEYNSNKLCIVDELSTNDTLKCGRERAIHKVSNAVRKKFSLANPFSNAQKHSNLDFNERNITEQHSSGRRYSAQNETKKLTKDKSRRRKTDKRILGWPEENENQQLLIDEADDE